MSLLITDPSEQHHSRVVPILTGLFILCVIAAMGVVLYVMYSQLLQEDDESAAVVTPEVDLQSVYASAGTLPAPAGEDVLNYGLAEINHRTDNIRGYILATAQATEPQDAMPRIYVVSPQDRKLGIKLLLPEHMRYGANIEVNNVDDPTIFLLDAEQTAFSQVLTNDEPRANSFQKFDVSKAVPKEFKSITGELVGHLDWSEEANKVAYMRYNGSESSPAQELLIQNWEVVISNIETDTVETVIPRAANPVWSPDGSKLFFLRPDGLYMYYPSVQREKRIRAIEEGQVLSNSGLDVSPNGAHLIWTFADPGLVVVHDILSWEPFTMQEVGRLHEDGVAYASPQFSPDSKYYAVHSYAPTASGQAVANLNVRAVKGREDLGTYSTGSYSSFVIDAWTHALPIQFNP